MRRLLVLRAALALLLLMMFVDGDEGRRRCAVAIGTVDGLARATRGGTVPPFGRDERRDTARIV